MSGKIKRVIYFLVAILLAFVLNFVKSYSNNDRASIEIRATDSLETVTTVDIAGFSPVKYYLEPNMVSLTVKYKNLDKNSEYKCVLNNLHSDIYQGSKKGLLKNITADDNLQVSANGDLQLLLEISVPRTAVYQKNVGQGELIVYKNGKVWSDCEINIINSRY